MNYRHAYHAGNFADVLKHVTLVAILDHLGRKPAPYFYLDTHAGSASYPVDAPETRRAGEFRDGLARLLAAPSVPGGAISRYLDLVKSLGMVAGKLGMIPGSPLLALAAMRNQDTAALCELQPKEANALKRAISDSRAHIHERDGYEAVSALLPPKEKRGVVLIDPPYESPDEYDRLRNALTTGLDRWPQGVFAAWYPITQEDAAGRFLERMAATGIRRQLVVELCVRRDDSPGGLNGSGMLLVNPPWQLDDYLGRDLPWLQRLLAVDGPGRSRVSWQVPE
jgi:23S rRNA (adenine2030-N6)-methyltransferase